MIIMTTTNTMMVGLDFGKFGLRIWLFKLQNRKIATIPIRGKIVEFLVQMAPRCQSYRFNVFVNVIDGWDLSQVHSSSLGSDSATRTHSSRTLAILSHSKFFLFCFHGTYLSKSKNHRLITIVSQSCWGLHRFCWLSSLFLFLLGNFSDASLREQFAYPLGWVDGICCCSCLLC